MIKIMVAFMVISLASCTKENSSTCYHCTFGVVNGVRAAPVDYCGDDGGKRQFTDAQGNDLPSQCIKK